MGNGNFWCCKSDNYYEKEKIFEKDGDDIMEVKTGIEHFCVEKIPSEKNFVLNKENILKYLNGELEDKIGKGQISKLDEFYISQDELDRAEKIFSYDRNKTHYDYLISKYIDNDDNLTNFLLKVLDLDYSDENENYKEEVEAYMINSNTNLSSINNNKEDSNKENNIDSINYFKFTRDNFKELVLLRNHPRKMIIKPLGFHQIDNKILVAYDHYENSLEYLIMNKTLDYVNKLKLLKNILELAKFLFIEGIISFDLNVKNLRLTSTFIVKLCSLRNSFDINSEYEFTKFTTVWDNKQIHLPPEFVTGKYEAISLKSLVWSVGLITSMLFSDRVYEFKEDYERNYREGLVPSKFYTGIENIYIKSMVLGILRIDPKERPTILDLIDVYNLLIEKEKDKLPNYELFKLKYDKEAFTSIYLYFI